MPDISMCRNKSCPLNKKCYRYTAIPNPLSQSYTSFEYKNGNCDDFESNK